MQQYKLLDSYLCMYGAGLVSWDPDPSQLQQGSSESKIATSRKLSLRNICPELLGCKACVFPLLVGSAFECSPSISANIHSASSLSHEVN